MNLTFNDQFILPGNPGVVWNLLDNPTTIPEIIQKEFAENESITEIAVDRYLAVAKFPLGFFRITFNSIVSVEDKIKPSSLRIVVSGKGGGGSVYGVGDVVLSPHLGGYTKLIVNGEGELGGILKFPGESVAMLVAQKVLSRFFNALSKKLGEMTQDESN